MGGVRLDPAHLPYSSSRQFLLAGYNHDGLLLLRSDRLSADVGAKRVEILFQDTRFVSLPTFPLGGLEINLGDVSLVSLYLDNPLTLDLDLGVSVFAVRGCTWRGFVVAGSLWMSEDDADPGQPSRLGLIFPFANPFGVHDED
jgi:hypothetical protein